MLDHVATSNSIRLNKFVATLNPRSTSIFIKKELDTFLRTYIKFQLRFDFDILLYGHTLDFRSSSNLANMWQNSCLNPLDQIATKGLLQSNLKYGQGHRSLSN